MPSPSPGSNNDNLDLYGVAATSARNAWAVGTFGLIPNKCVILHWNGTAWKQAGQSP